MKNSILPILVMAAGVTGVSVAEKTAALKASRDNFDRPVDKEVCFHVDENVGARDAPSLATYGCPLLDPRTFAGAR